mmetsp:Transcript_64601/g.179134  ORF Transcript_64601/g.179134 Transcript_64601/m.179134 type:complete len:280 (-) Transcript_64601:921-1760(-)
MRRHWSPLSGGALVARGQRPCRLCLRQCRLHWLDIQHLAHELCNHIDRRCLLRPVLERVVCGRVRLRVESPHSLAPDGLPDSRKELPDLADDCASHAAPLRQRRGLVRGSMPLLALRHGGAHARSPADLLQDRRSHRGGAGIREVCHARSFAHGFEERGAHAHGRTHVVFLHMLHRDPALRGSGNGAGLAHCWCGTSCFPLQRRVQRQDQVHSGLLYHTLFCRFGHAGPCANNRADCQGFAGRGRRADFQMGGHLAHRPADGGPEPPRDGGHDQPLRGQ